MDAIVEQIKQEMNTWRGGDLFRFHHKQDLHENKDTIFFTVHNHIADFGSKYNLEGEFFHTSNSWFIAREWDEEIVDNLFDLSDQFNEKFPKLHFDVIEPGNVLMITKKT